MAGHLNGLRVLDLTMAWSGPFCSMFLADMGAEVIKIEPKKGDGFRNYGSDRRYDGMSPAFIAANAGKKSIALDLKDEADLEIARAIVARSQVLLENFRPGVIERLGLGYQAVCQLRPDIVYCSISGYGQKSAQRDWPAIDNIVQATSGMMMLSGEEGDPPIRIGFPIVDTLTGQTAALAILSALMQRERTGDGSYIDVSMFDASLAFMTSALTPFLVTGKPMQRMGNIGYSGLPTSSLFMARDGRQVALGVVQSNQFAALAVHVGRPEWLEDPRFADAEARRQNFAAMEAELAAVMATRDAADWEACMSAAGIPCGMVRTVDEATELAGEGALLSARIDGLPDTGEVRFANAGFRMAPSAPGTNQPPPRLDGNRDEILAWLAEEGGAANAVCSPCRS